MHMDSYLEHIKRHKWRFK